MHIKSIVVPAAFALALAASSGWAGGLDGLVGGVGGAVGGITKGVGNTVSKVTGAAQLDVNVDSGATLDRAALDGEISARLARSSNRKLLQLCLSAGGKNCENSSRAQRISIIDARLPSLSGQELLGLCGSVGGSCGSAATTAASQALPKTAAGHQERADAAICPQGRRTTVNGKAYCLVPLPQ